MQFIFKNWNERNADRSRISRIANSKLNGYELDIDEAGVACLRRTKAHGRENKEQKAYREALQMVIGDKRTTVVNATSDTAGAIGGAFFTTMRDGTSGGLVDPKDLGEFGAAEPRSAASSFGHEFMEQYGRQQLGMDYPEAHELALIFEATFSGWIHDQTTLSPPGQRTATETFSRGNRRTDVRMFWDENGNVTSVDKKERN